METLNRSISCDRSLNEGADRPDGIMQGFI